MWMDGALIIHKRHARFETINLEELYSRFYETVEKMIRSNLFDFVAHLDNLKVFNYKVKDEAFNQKWYERIAEALKESNTATEVNAGFILSLSC